MNEKPKNPSAKATRNTVIVLLALVIIAALAAFAFQQHQAKSKAREEAAAAARDEAAFQELLPRLALVIRAENPEPGQLAEAEKLLAENAAPQGPLTERAAAGARAFLGENLKEADANFAAASQLKPESPDLYSFQAAANLKLGNTARAEELYLKALALKSGAGYGARFISSDQLGLALCLFLLHRADEALPLAEQAWDIRHRELGPAAFDTISAAGRLATVYVALNKTAAAETLLKQSYLDALNEEEANAAVLEEVRLFLETIAKAGGKSPEMAEFFAAAVPTDFSPKAPEATPEPEPEKKPEPLSAATLSQWEELARQMMGHDDSLAADLWVKVIIGRQGFAGLDLYHPDLRPVHLDLVRAFMAAGRFNEAEEELRPLLGSVTDRESEEFLELSAMMARIQEGAGRFKDAEAEWLAMAEIFDAQVTEGVKTKAGADPAAVDAMLNLHLQIAENYLMQGKAAAEAELELRAALGRLNPRLINTYPGTAEIYLRLARMLKSADGRGRDSNDYYRRAKRAAETVLKRKPEPETQGEMENLLAAVAEETKPTSKAKKPTEETPPEAAAEPEKKLPEPEMLRLELSALAVLGRLAEFQPRIEGVLAEAAERHGENSAAYLRYYSLKLKALEEEGRTDELTRELLAQSAKPLGRNALEQALNKSSALTYAARANEKAGRIDMAIKLYQDALTTLNGQEQEAAATARRNMIEEALAALKN